MAGGQRSKSYTSLLMTDDTQSLYKFGDSNLAAERLRLLAAAFEPSTRAFLSQLPLRAPLTIADLGCGPGHTTRMLQEVFSAARVLGVDNSASFVELARSTVSEVSFALADVSQTLSDGTYDLIYARYLLTHVPDIRGAINCWSKQLAPGGLIAIEENQSIATEQPAFRAYLSIVAAMLAADNQQLFVGAQLDAAHSWPSLDKVSSELTPVRLSRSVAARIFLPNLQTWRSRPFIQRNYDAGTIARLEGELQDLTQDEGHQPAITFGLRQIVLQLRKQV